LTSGDKNFNDFPEDQLTKVVSYNLYDYICSCVQLKIVCHWHPVTQM